MAAANMNAISHQYLKKWEYNMNQPLPTHLHRTAKSHSRNLHSSNAVPSQYAQILLGRSNDHCGVPYQSITERSDRRRNPLRKMVSKATSDLRFTSTKTFRLHRTHQSTR